MVKSYVILNSRYLSLKFKCCPKFVSFDIWIHIHHSNRIGSFLDIHYFNYLEIIFFGDTLISDSHKLRRFSLERAFFASLHQSIFFIFSVCNYLTADLFSFIIIVQMYLPSPFLISMVRKMDRFDQICDLFHFQIISLYPYLVQFTETSSPQISSSVKDALMEYHDLLQPFHNLQ